MHGGKRPNQTGRPIGAKGKLIKEVAAATQKLDKEAIAAGVTPLQVMLELMRDKKNDKDLRLEAAKAAAPYVHRRQPADVFVTQYNDPLGTQHDREAALDRLLDALKVEQRLPSIN